MGSWIDCAQASCWYRPEASMAVSACRLSWLSAGFDSRARPELPGIPGCAPGLEKNLSRAQKPQSEWDPGSTAPRRVAGIDPKPAWQSAPADCPGFLLDLTRVLGLNCLVFRGAPQGLKKTSPGLKNRKANGILDRLRPGELLVSTRSQHGSQRLQIVLAFCWI